VAGGSGDDLGGAQPASAIVGVGFADRRNSLSKKQKQSGGYQGCNCGSQQPMGVYPLKKVIENPFKHCICNEIE
jgi:hypothetical protein